MCALLGRTTAVPSLAPCCCRPRLDQLGPLLHAAQEMGYDVSAATAGVDNSTGAAAAAAAVAPTAADAATSAAAAAAAGSLQEQQRLLLAHFAQAAASGQAWIDGAVAFTEQLRALARGQGLPPDSDAGAGTPPAAAAPGAPSPSPAAVAPVSNPHVAGVVARARAHLAQLPGLSVAAGPESETLAEAAKAYCLCQCLYDEISPMLGCDYCSDWFHWECVGLPPPRPDQDPSEAAPPDWRCARRGLLACSSSSACASSWHQPRQSSSNALQLCLCVHTQFPGCVATCVCACVAAAGAPTAVQLPACRIRIWAACHAS
jgi:hypothetical protein